MPRPRSGRPTRRSLARRGTVLLGLCLVAGWTPSLGAQDDGPKENRLCLSCHATHGPFSEVTVDMVANIDDPEVIKDIGAIVSAHSNHPYGPERVMGLSNCVDCHMPKIAKSAINYDIRSHTFEAIPPTSTLVTQAEGGMPNSCAVSCHSQKVNTFGFGLDPSISTWDGPFDVDTATELEVYFGPGGLWYDLPEDE